MRFSILVPVYNVEKYLPACVDSLLNQTCKDYEVILVNDGSKDGSGAICDAYAAKHDHVRVVHKENQGLVSARRVGLKHAQGEYCIFCDSDDLVELDALAQINQVIEEHNADIVIYNAQNYMDGETTPFFTDIFEEGMVTDKGQVYDLLLLSYKINSLCMKACRTNLIDIDQDYSAYYSCNYGEDLLQTVPIVNRAERIYYLNRILYNYRVTTGMTSHYNPKHYWSYRTVNKRIGEHLADRNIPDLQQKLAVHLLVAAYGATTQFKYADAVDETEIDRLASEEDFRKAYQTIKGTKYKKELNGKQRLILFLLYNRYYKAIDLLLSVRRKK